MYFAHRRSLLLVSLAHLSFELSNNFLPVLYPMLMSTLGLAYAQVGLITLVAAAGGTLAQPIFGYITDRWDPWRIVVMAIIWSGILMSLTGFTGNYALLVLVVGMGALGSAAFHPAAASIAGSTSLKNRGAAVSFFTVGGNIGAALSPLLVTAGLRWSGMQGTWIVMPVAILAASILFCTMGLRPKPQKRTLPPSGDRAHSSPLRESASGLALVVGMVMTRSWVHLSFATYLPEWIQAHGATLFTSSRWLFGFSASIAVGGLLGGAASDRIGRWQIIASSMLLLALSMWLFPDATGVFRIILLCTAGLTIGAGFPVGIVMAQDVWPRGAGVASALVIGLGWMPGGIGASVTGILADRFSLAYSLRALALPPLLGVVAALAFAALQKRSVRDVR